MNAESAPLRLLPPANAAAPAPESPPSARGPAPVTSPSQALSPPLSKSDAQRRLVLEHLLGLPASELDPRSARDVHVLARALATLRRFEKEFASTSDSVPHPHDYADVDCADGGAPFRLFVGQAAVTPGAKLRIRGTPRLGERPHGPLFTSLVHALGDSGVKLTEGNPWPLLVDGVMAASFLSKPVFRIDAAESSQFPSSLLFAAASLAQRERRPWTVKLEGTSASRGYLKLSLHWLECAGFRVDVDDSEGTYIVHALKTAPYPLPLVPGDWSSLGYLLVLAWKSGLAVTDVDETAAHPDRAIVRVLRGLGLSVSLARDGSARVQGRAQGGLDVSGEECPDLLPTLAVLACGLPAPSVLRDVRVLKAKESDRLEGIRQLVTAAGGQVHHDVETDALHLTPPTTIPSGPLHIDSHDDHRLAMSGATLAALQGREAVITHPECVAKSFPHFWEEFAKLGFAMR